MAELEEKIKDVLERWFTAECSSPVAKEIAVALEVAPHKLSREQSYRILDIIREGIENHTPYTPIWRDVMCCLRGVAEDDKSDLPITPGHWYGEFDHLNSEQLVCSRARGVIYTICRINRQVTEWRENKKAIAALPKVLSAAKDAYRVLSDVDLGPAASMRISAMKDALEEAGVKL